MKILNHQSAVEETFDPILKRKRRSASIWRVVFLLGLFLLGLNIVGLFRTMRSPRLHADFPGDVSLPLQTSLERLERRGLPTERYLHQVNEAVHHGMAHYWSDEGTDTYYLRVPLWENYLLHLASYLHSEAFGKYEFCSPRKALERGVGLCSQHTFAVVETLNRNGIEAHVIGLNIGSSDGHIVGLAYAGDQAHPTDWWILDADYGVILPVSLADLRRKPEVVRSYYSQVVQDTETLNRLTRIYSGKSVNYGDVRGYWNRNSSLHPYELEIITYYSIWILPLIMIIAGCWKLIMISSPKGSSDRKFNFARSECNNIK